MEKMERELAKLSAQIRSQQNDKEEMDHSITESDSLDYNNQMSAKGQETNSASTSKKNDHSSSIFDKDGLNQVICYKIVYRFNKKFM